MFLGKYFPPSMVTKLRNEIIKFRQRPNESLFEAWEHYKLLIDRYPNHNMFPITQIDTFYNGLTLRHHDTINAAAGGTFMKRRPKDKSKQLLLTVKLVVVLIPSPIVQPSLAKPKTYMMREPTKVEIPTNLKANDAILKNMQTNMTSLTNSNLELKNMFGQFIKMNTASSSASRTLPGNTVTNPKEELQGITTRSGIAYQGPTIPTTSSSLPLTESSILNSEPIVAPIIEPVVAPVSALKSNQRHSIPYPSRLHDQKLRDKANDQKEKIFQFFQDLNFNISFADALILMPKFGPTIKTLLTNKDKLSKLARTPLNEHCSAVLLKKFPEKLRDPSKFLIPRDFLRMAERLVLTDLGANINLMPLSVWNKLSLPELSPTCMTLELADRSISRLVGVAGDVFVKVGTFHFPADFVVVDFDADPQVPLILGRSFLKTERALIDVFEGELTICVGREAITFNLDQISRYSAKYNDMMTNRIDVINMACEEDSDFLLEEVDAFLALEDDATSPEVDQSYFDTEGDILLLEAFLNDDPSLPSPNQGNYLPQVRKELKIFEAKTDKSLIDEPPEVELKDLPPHLEYTFLESDNKLPIIIAKYLSNEEKTALIAEKSHFMVKEGIVLGHKISKNGIEVDKAKVDVIAKLPHSTTVKGAVLGQHQEKHFRPIHYASKTMTEAELNYTTMEKEMLAVVYAFKKFWSYLIMNKSIVYTDHSALKYLFAKKDSKARLLRWVLLLQEFTFKVIDTKRAENLATDHLSRLESPHQNVLDPKEIIESFPFETLNMVSFRATAYHPQTSCQVEVSNHGLKRILERTVGENHASWSDKLDDALWAFRTTYKTPIGCTPYKLVYEKACHLPIKLEHKAYWDLKHANFDLQTEKIKRLHDSKIKDRVFNIDDRVLLFKSRLKIFSGKLKTHWSGPFTISHVFPYGTVELSQTDGPNFKVNGHRLKHYFGEDIPKMVVPNLQTFPMDQ
nr:reverse transcriptase domain-containing protein [Tanacetum cinerariifolium]